MDNEIKRLRRKFFILSSEISLAVIFIMLLILNVLMSLSYQNEFKVASDILQQTAFSNASDVSVETIRLRDVEKAHDGKHIIKRDPKTIKKITLIGNISCADKNAAWYSAGGGILFDYPDENGNIKHVHREYIFNHDERRVTIDFTDGSEFYYQGRLIDAELSDMGSDNFYVSQVWWATHSNSTSNTLDEAVSLIIDSVEITYTEGISVTSFEDYSVTYRSIDEIYPSGVPDTLQSYNFFYIVCDKEGHLIEVNSGNSSLVFSKGRAEQIIKNDENWTNDGTEYECNVSSNKTYTVYSYMSHAQDDSDQVKLIVISAFSGGGVFAVVLILIYIFSGRAVKPISESYSRQKEFISNASHELKTPITVISATTELLEKKKGSDSLTECISAQTEKMGRLVNEMLSLSRLSAPENVYSNFKKFNISHVLENSVLYFESRAFEENKKLVTDIKPDISFNGNPDKIDELAGILTDNALKYSDENSTIKITLNQIKDKIILTCENPCQSFDTNDIPHLFERFYRGDKSHSDETEGYGLGLSIAKEIAELHNGTIETKYKDKVISFTVIFHNK